MENSNEQTQIEEAIKAFNCMWGAFPSPVMLIKKNRSILAVNKIAQQFGVPTDIKCFTLDGNEGACSHCRANDMLKDEVAIRTVGARNGKVVEGYWIPTAVKDIYVHFGIDITEWANPELLQNC